MNKEQKKIVKAIILSISLFVIATIWFDVAKKLYTGGNPFVGFIILTLPFIIIPLLFVREKDFHDSFIFGAAIGFVGGTLFLIYWMAVPMITAPDPSADYSLLPGFWMIFTSLFTGSSIAGSMLSYPVRKLIGKIKEKMKK